MTRTIQFTKMHGAGNDYIYVNTLRFPIHNPGKTAIEWSACHTGIGSDGLVLIGHSDKADFSMRIFNADRIIIRSKHGSFLKMPTVRKQ